MNSRPSRAIAAPPVRLVHLGLGNFFRAHQAFYTAATPGWGIAAFTGRQPRQAELMAAQDSVYTLLTRGAAGDEFTLVDSVVSVHAAQDHAAWLRHLASPDVAALTITVTESAYLPEALAQGSRVLEDDLARLRADPETIVHTVPGRLLAGLSARWRAGGSPIAIIPCDNLSNNGATVKKIVCAAAESLGDSDFARWVRHDVSFVNTMVDRITPSTTDADRCTVLTQTGLVDECVVVTEPYTEWVLNGKFPSGRPSWQDAGARFVADVEPYERRKLWMLNGAHSLLAYAGSIRGHDTIAAAIADEACLRWVGQWWDDVERHLDLPAAAIADYRAELLDRFVNPGIAHRLAQIAMDGSQKLPIRVLPVLLRERTAGGVSEAGAITLAAWLLHLRGVGAPVVDADGARAVEAARGPLQQAIPTVLDRLSPGLGEDAELVRSVAHAVTEFGVPT